jgi:hypothetical protein
MIPEEDPFYVTGGTLRPDGSSYVERATDGGLLQSLRARRVLLHPPGEPLQRLLAVLEGAPAPALGLAVRQPVPGGAPEIGPGDAGKGAKAAPGRTRARSPAGSAAFFRFRLEDHASVYEGGEELEDLGRMAGVQPLPAASRVHPPADTHSRRRTMRSGSVRSHQLQSIAARNV